ncbi:MAG: hypothetical protein WBO43_00965 [Gemmatimonadota bacterium]
MKIYRVTRFALLSSALALLSVACGDSDDGGSTGPDPTGGIEVTLTIAGDAIDADGCVFTIDGGSTRRLLAGESTTYTGLSVGQHEVVISDVAGNCQVLGDATRSISVAADQTATATFAVTCAQDVGAIAITTQTSGEELDPDGYQVVVDGGAPAAIGINGSLTAGGLAPGDHTVALQDVAANCSVAGGNPRTVAVTAGQTAAAAFTVTCSSTSGSMAISASTNGEDLDEDGYEIVVDGGAPSAIGINGSLTAGGLAPGDYSVALQGEAFNCSVGGNNPRTVTVTGGAEAQVTFDVNCRYHLYDRIAFQSNRGGNWMLYAVDPYDPGAGVRALGREGTHPAVSPDGLRIAYSFENEIWIARSDGSGAARITSTAANEYYPAWSSDGNRIAYERDGEIWTMREDGSNQVRIFDFGTHPTWSPDGSRVAFTDAGDIWILNADGSGLTGLTGNPTANQHPAWSPLGNYIGFASARDGSLHVFVQDPAGGPAINMTIALISHATDPTWAPAAEAGAFSSEATGTSDIYYFVPGSAGVVRLTTNPAFDVHPSWGGGN